MFKLINSISQLSIMIWPNVFFSTPIISECTFYIFFWREGLERIMLNLGTLTYWPIWCVILNKVLFTLLHRNCTRVFPCRPSFAIIFFYIALWNALQYLTQIHVVIVKQHFVRRLLELLPLFPRRKCYKCSTWAYNFIKNKFMV